MAKKKKSKIKKAIGPVTVTPRVRNQQSVDGKVKTDEKGGGLTIDTKTKNFTYGKEFNVGKNTKIRINANKGKAKGSGGNSKTKGGEISISKTFNSGGMVRTGKPKLAKKGWK